MMDAETTAQVLELVQRVRIAALGTLHQGAPRVSSVPFAVVVDPFSFLVHISRLALHTQDILEDPRVGFMVAEPDSPARNPQAIARLSVQGVATRIANDDEAHDACRELFLGRFPQSAINFGLGDFALFRIVPRSGRFIAGFGRIHDVRADDFARHSPPYGRESP
jgi:putative heme iron utilization protein